MAATIAKFAVQLSIRASKFNAGLDGARKRLSRFGAGIANVGKRIAQFGIATAALAAGALVVMTKRAFGTIDATTKLARALGFTTEQLTGYQFAAQIAGIESAELSKSFKRMVKNISDANLGLTTAQRAFGTEAGLGLDFKRLLELSPDKQFKLIADALSKMTAGANKTRVAIDLFGRTGEKILELTKDGAAGLKKQAEEAKKLGLAYSGVDGAKIEAANDAITRAKSAIQGLVNQLAIKVAPLVEALANAFTNWATAGEGAAARVTSAFDSVVNFIGVVIDAIDELELRWIKFAKLTASGQVKVFQGSEIGAEQETLKINARLKELQEGKLGSARFRERMNEIAAAATLAAEKVAAAGGGTGGIGSIFDTGKGIASKRQSAFGSGAREFQASGGGGLDKFDRMIAAEQETNRLLRQMDAKI